jgi:hypothetical protein
MESECFGFGCLTNRTYTFLREAHVVPGGRLPVGSAPKSMDVTERYLDHYAQYLGEPVGAYPFSISDELPAIRILAYDNVIDGCRVFASLGLSSFPGEGGELCEVMCPIDKAWEDAPAILAQSLFRMVARDPFRPARGVAVDGIGLGNPDFVKKYKKSALYLTDPFELPEEFAFVDHAGVEGRMYLAIFLNEDEYNFLAANDCEKFEDQLEEKGVDPYDIKRKSCV